MTIEHVPVREQPERPNKVRMTHNQTTAWLQQICVRGVQLSRITLLG